ncbi:MAG: cytochrome bc complex cytochrome b subunit [Chloroflexi bacterium]|nr:cytochrome bc complex cytochrome b subunit [Chloroflexota bacterium]
MIFPFSLRRTYRLLLFPVIALSFAALVFISSVSAAEPSLQSTETPPAIATPTFDLSRLDAPVTAEPPGQIDRGAIHYWGVCMACHGDYGQGLIESWRDGFGEDKNCWQSKCHGDDHPLEDGFKIPKDNLAPPIAGPGSLARFDNAFELYEYIYETMPWWNPGSITQEEAWALTNYVLKLNGTRPEGLVLSPENGYAIPVHRATSFPESELPGTLTLAGVLLLAAFGIFLQARPRLKELAASTPKPNFYHHLHPPSISKKQAQFRHTLGAGGLSIFLSLILLITGLLEMFFYIPTPEEAAVSIETLTLFVPFGNLVRNLHYWSAQILLVVMIIHLLRVILTGAYAKPRRFNFLLGLILMILILLLDFTGYVLRWDEGIRWALVVGTNLLKTIPGIGENLYLFVMGGPNPGSATLTRFYTWHIFGLTFAVIILIVWHVFRVRRDGGIAAPPPKKRKEKARVSRFELVRREVLAMAIAGAILLLISVFIPAPIGQPITDTSIDISDSHAPWFFLWVQQLLKYGDPFILGILTPLIVVLLFGFIPYLLPRAKAEELGKWFPRGNQIAQALALILVLAMTVLTALASYPTVFGK